MMPSSSRISRAPFIGAAVIWSIRAVTPCPIAFDHDAKVSGDCARLADLPAAILFANESEPLSACIRSGTAAGACIPVPELAPLTGFRVRPAVGDWLSEQRPLAEVPGRG